MKLTRVEKDDKILNILTNHIDLQKIVLLYKSSSEAKKLLIKNYEVYKKIKKKEEKEKCHLNKIYLTDNLSVFEGVLKKVCSKFFFKNNKNEILEFLSKKYFNITSKNIITKKEEKFILKEILKTGISFFLKKQIDFLLISENQKYSNYQLLIADPKIDLEFWNSKINSQNFSDLIQNNYLIKKNFFSENNSQKILESINFIFKLNLLNTVNYSKNDLLYFDLFYQNSKNVEDEEFKFLISLSKNLCKFPNFYNSKIFLPMRISWNLRILLTKNFKDIILDDSEGSVFFYLGILNEKKNIKKNFIKFFFGDLNIDIEPNSLVIRKKIDAFVKIGKCDDFYHVILKYDLFGKS